MQDSELQQLAKTDRNPVQETRYQELLKQSNVPFTLANGRASVGNFGTGGNGTSTQSFNQATGMGNTAADGMGIINTPTIDLVGVYNNLHKNSGIADLEQQLSDKTNAFTTAQTAINDDPFLAEGNRVGRVQKLSNDYESRVANLKNDIATKKADIETQLGLQTKQFDINSQAAQQSFQQFTSLLQMGALDGASGDTIASITRSTGLTSDMIKAAVDARKVKDIPTQIISYDDGNNQGFAVINSQTGEVIKQQVVAASKQPAAGSGESSIVAENRQIEQDQKLAPQYATTAAKQGKTIGDLMSTFQQYGMSPQQIWDIYKAVNYYKMTDAQAKADKKKFNVK